MTYALTYDSILKSSLPHKVSVRMKEDRIVQVMPFLWEEVIFPRKECSWEAGERSCELG